MVKNNLLKINAIQDASLVDGPGIRMVIFTVGCIHACPGCHNFTLQNFNTTLSFFISKEDLVERIRENLEFIDGLTLSGGDPLFQSSELKEYLKYIRSQEDLKKLDILMYTGYLLEDIPKGITQYIDTIIDGKYDKDLPKVRFAGSSNQRMWKKFPGTNRFTIEEWKQ